MYTWLFELRKDYAWQCLEIFATKNRKTESEVESMLPKVLA
jgi:hypothetical protein